MHTAIQGQLCFKYIVYNISENFINSGISTLIIVKKISLCIITEPKEAKEVGA